MNRTMRLGGVAAAALGLAGCVSPVLTVAPGQGKTQAELQRDDAACRTPVAPATATPSDKEYYRCMSAHGENVVAQEPVAYAAYPAYGYGYGYGYGAPYGYPGYGYPYYGGYPFYAAYPFGAGYLNPYVGLGIGFGFGAGFYGGYFGRGFYGGGYYGHGYGPGFYRGGYYGGHGYGGGFGGGFHGRR